MPNYWTARRVVHALVYYTEIEDDLAAGMVKPGDEAGASVWEPGGVMEKLAGMKADLDMAILRLPPPHREALDWYFRRGFESTRFVGRRLGCNYHTAQKLICQGVSRVAQRLCGRPEAGRQAREMLQETRTAKKVWPKNGVSRSLCVVDERDIRAEAGLHEDA